MTDTMLDQRRSRRLDRTFREEELAGFRLSTQARLIALIVVEVWLQIWTEPPRTYWLEAILLLFALGGLAHFGLMRSSLYRIWQTYLFVGLDFLLLTLATIGLDLLTDGPWPAQMALRNGTVVYYLRAVVLRPHRMPGFWTKTL